MYSKNFKDAQIYAIQKPGMRDDSACDVTIAELIPHPTPGWPSGARLEVRQAYSGSLREAAHGRGTSGNCSTLGKGPAPQF